MHSILFIFCREADIAAHLVMSWGRQGGMRGGKLKGKRADGDSGGKQQLEGKDRKPEQGWEGGKRGEGW